MADEGGVDKVSGGSAVYESGGRDGSCSVLQSNRESQGPFGFIGYNYRGNVERGRGRHYVFLF